MNLFEKPNRIIQVQVDLEFLLCLTVLNTWALVNLESIPEEENSEDAELLQKLKAFSYELDSILQKLTSEDPIS
jgi:hypothetical protein